jgi:hypothetical protein
MFCCYKSVGVRESFTCSGCNRCRPKFETGRRASGWWGVIGRQRQPDAEAVEGAARGVIGRSEPAIASTNPESACAVVAKNAGHAHCRRRRDRAAPAPVPDMGHRAARAMYGVVVDAAVPEFVVQSAPHRRQILDLAISPCRFER